MRARTARASPENGYKLCVCTKDAISRVPYTGGKADIITVLRINRPRHKRDTLTPSLTIC